MKIICMLKTSNFLDLIKKNKKIFEIKKPLYKLNTKNNISTINKDKQRSYFLKALSQTK